MKISDVLDSLGSGKPAEIMMKGMRPEDKVKLKKILGALKIIGFVTVKGEDRRNTVYTLSDNAEDVAKELASIKRKPSSFSIREFVRWK